MPQADPWLPRRVLRPGTPIAKQIQDSVRDLLALPNHGPEDVRFEEDLRQLVQLIESGEPLYVCGARVRQLLDPAAPIRWSPQQRTKIERLSGLLHPKHMVARPDGYPPSARVVQGLIYAERTHTELNPLERAVIWRLSHLYPVLAFCELIVALGYPNQDSDPFAPSPLGAAVAAKSALELTAHFVSGGKSGKCDPFDDAMSFGYTDNLKELGKKNDEWRDAGEWYKTLCDALRGDQSGQLEVLDVCRKIVDLVCGIPDFKKEIPRDLGRLVPFEHKEGSVVEIPTEPYVVISYRNDFDKSPWPTSPETVGRSMSWSGFHSPRLQALGYSEVLAYDSPAFFDLSELMARMDSLTTFTGKTGMFLRNVKSLMHAFCVSCNLGNILALGAIARQLHLQVEELTVEAKLCDPFIHKKVDESRSDFDKRKPKEDDKSLKCIAEELEKRSSKMAKLNSIRCGLQDILQSFAHPGWLIRTELLRVREDPDRPSTQTLFVTYGYAPPFIAAVDAVDGRRTRIDLRPVNPCAKSHFDELSRAFPLVLRTAMTGNPDGKIEPGSAIDIPFVAIDLCRRAIEAVCDALEKRR